MRFIGKLLYGLLFIAIYPILLLLIAKNVHMPFPMFKSPLAGGPLALVALLIMFWGMIQIILRGKGLPMNAYPPKKLVTDGVFGLVPHPIYFGFSLIILGLSIYFGSGEGLYLVTPIVIFSTTSLVLGYENHYLRRTFGRIPDPIFSPINILKRFTKLIGLDNLYIKFLNWGENKANSWKAWRIGPFRVINHFLYSGLAGGVLAAYTLLISGTEFRSEIAVIIIVGLIGAAIVGQLLVGTNTSLSRPYGYFGGLLFGTIFGIVLCLFDSKYFKLYGAFCLAAPVAQIFGRVRCLIQGCCHGGASSNSDSIVVHNHHSRVCSMSNLCDTPISPTQIYSMIGNLFLELILIIYWFSGVNLTTIIGTYYIGSGLIRFVEESYRGEPGTKIVRNLRIYQWFSIGIYVSGLLILLIPSAKTYSWQIKDLWQIGIYFIVFFILCAIAMSVDMPESKVPFSKLSG